MICLSLLWLNAINLGAVAYESVFQGECGSMDYVCEQVCVDLQEGTFECTCFQGYRLLPDGVSCIRNNSPLNVYYRSEKVQRGHRKIANCGWLFSSSSSMRFQPPEDSYLYTNISIIFRPAALNGLIFYAGQSYGRDFMSLHLEAGSLVFRFDCGEGIIEETIHSSLLINAWHSLNISRKYCDHVELQLLPENVDLIDNTNLKHYKGISISNFFYVGAIFEDYEMNSEKNSNSDPLLDSKLTMPIRHFLGCVKYLKINEDVLLDSKKNVTKARRTINIDKCSECW